ncbi:MAG TPA: hypothetical protein ENK59_04935 [Thioploca sp.]|nr:hypothetical protein [Thioploca sp.]
MLINKLYLIILLLNWISYAQAADVILTVNKTGDGNGVINSVPTGINCGDNCIFPYAENTSVTLTAIPQFSSFTGWSGDCDGVETDINITVDIAKTCNANFNLFSSIQFSNSVATVDEDIGQISLSVTRAGGSVGTVSVAYNTIDGTAIAGDDYTAVSSILTWQTGEMTTKTIQIPIFADGITEDNEQFTVELSNISTGAVLGNTISTTITITDPPPNPAGMLQFAAKNYVASEGNGLAIINVERLEGKTGSVAVNYQTISNVATTSDYIDTQGMLAWNDGDMATKTLTIPITADAITEFAEPLAIRLFNPIGGVSLGTNMANLHIIDDLGTPLTIDDLLGTPNTILIPGVIQFSVPADYKAAKDVGNITININRVYGGQGQIQVNYNTQDGTAKAGNDYTAIIGTLNWLNGDISAKKITIPILPTSQAKRKFMVNLSNPTDGSSLGAFPTATIEIVDSLSNPTTEIASGGIIQFSAANYQVNESDGNVTITINRSGDVQGEVEVFYSTEHGTADNKDYIAIKNSVKWLANENDPKSFQINVYDDGLIENDETVLLKLFNLTGKAELGSNSTANLTIFDNDATSIQLSSNSYQVNETDKEVTITASRIGGGVEQIMLVYETTDITAIAGIDYAATNASSGLLIWTSGETGEKSFTIPIYDDKEVEGNETLRVKLRLIETQNTSILGTPIEAIITIIDDDTGDCKLKTNIIDCIVNNTGNLLQNIKIVSRGMVQDGQLGGKIELASDNTLNQAILRDVTLLANTNIIGTAFGGKISGNIIGNELAPAIIDNVTIAANTTLSHVIIGKLTNIENDLILQDNGTWLSSIQLDKGVLFEDNSSIPYMVDLSKVLGKIHTPDLELDAIDLNHDILFNGEKILNYINGLHVFTSLGIELWQNPDTGYLTVKVDNKYYKVLPTQARHIWGKVENTRLIPIGTTVAPNGQVIFVTHTGREIITIPVVHEAQSLRDGLIELGLSNVTMLANGNLKILFGEDYYMARPNLFATEAPTNIPLGIGATNLTWLENLNEAFLIFDTIDTTEQPIALFEANDKIRSKLIRQQQFIYPAAAKPDILYALAAERENPDDDCQTKLYNDGRVSMCIGVGQNKQIYKGVLDYLVKSGTETVDTLQIVEINDINGDGLQDYRLIYPNGDQQIMYRCTGCVE